MSKPLGNINRKSFIDIWNSHPYQEFRYKAKSLPKSKFYFREINCYKSCDNVGMNLEIKELISSNKKQQELNYPTLEDKKINGECVLPKADFKLIISASKFKSGNLNIREHEFGRGIVIDGGKGFGFAEYEIKFKKSGDYELWVYYASDKERPVELYFDGRLITKEALNCRTGGWSTEFLRWFRVTIFDIDAGKRNLKIFTSGLIPHIHSFSFLKGVKNA
jgi:hypothetical protein